VWVRATVCYRKMNDTWVVVHEHASVPLYMDGSDRAAVDLSPEGSRSTEEPGNCSSTTAPEGRDRSM
jgi:hypothetical protein